MNVIPGGTLCKQQTMVSQTVLHLPQLVRQSFFTGTRP